MSLTYRLFDSIDEVDQAAWERIRSRSRAPIFMDPGLIGALEATMKDTCQFWHVIVYGEGDDPVAAASLTAMKMDLLNHADPGLQAIIRRLPGMLSRFRRLNMLICGLPLSAGQKNVEIVSSSDGAAVMTLLDGLVRELAAKTKMDVIVYKEFADADLPWADSLLKRGYRRIPTLPMHYFAPAFDSFDHYLASVRAHYRNLINRSTRKLRNNGIEVSFLTDTKAILDLYTPEAHSLYLQILDRTETKLEILPIEFFRELAVRLAGKVEFITIHKDGKIFALAWCLHDDPAYYLLFGGIDYAFNADFDLYFNLFYASLDRALGKGVSRIEVGQTANTFKSRLGCTSEALYAYVKGVGPFISLFIRYGAGLLVVQKPTANPRNIFKRDAGDHPAPRTG